MHFLTLVIQKTIILMKRVARIAVILCIGGGSVYGQTAEKDSNRIAWFVDSVFVINPECINPSNIKSFSINPDSSIQTHGIDYKGVAYLTYRPKCELLSLKAIGAKYCRIDETDNPIYMINGEFVTQNIDSYFIDADIIAFVSNENIENFNLSIRSKNSYQSFHIIRIITDRFARENSTFFRMLTSNPNADRPAIIVNEKQVNRASLCGMNPERIKNITVQKDTTLKVSKTIYNAAIEIKYPDSLYVADQIRQHFLPDVPPARNVYMIDDQFVKADPDLPLMIDKDYILAIDCVRCQDFESWGDLMPEFYIIRIHTKSPKNIPRLIGNVLN